MGIKSGKDQLLRISGLGSQGGTASILGGDQARDRQRNSALYQSEADTRRAGMQKEADLRRAEIQDKEAASRSGLALERDQDARDFQLSRDRMARDESWAERGGLPKGYDSNLWEMAPDEQALSKAQASLQALKAARSEGKLSEGEYEQAQQAAMLEVEQAQRGTPKRKSKTLTGEGGSEYKEGDTESRGGFVYEYRMDPKTGSLQREKIGEDKSFVAPETADDKAKKLDQKAKAWDTAIKALPEGTMAERRALVQEMIGGEAPEPTMDLSREALLNSGGAEHDAILKARGDLMRGGPQNQDPAIPAAPAVPGEGVPSGPPGQIQPVGTPQSYSRNNIDALLEKRFPKEGRRGFGKTYRESVNKAYTNWQKAIADKNPDAELESFEQLEQWIEALDKGRKQDYSKLAMRK